MTRPQWHVNRAVILQRACISAAREIAEGVCIGDALAAAAKRFNGTSLGAGRRLQLSPKNMRRWWDVWNRHDCDASTAFAWRYRPGKRHEIDATQLAKLAARLLIAEKPSLAALLRHTRVTSAAGKPVHGRTIYRRIPAGPISRIATRQRRLLMQHRDLQRKKEASLLA